MLWPRNRVAAAPSTIDSPAAGVDGREGESGNVARDEASLTSPA